MTTTALKLSTSWRDYYQLCKPNVVLLKLEMKRVVRMLLGKLVELVG